MQLDRTEVVIRTRTLSELGDLSLRLLHRFPKQIVPVALAGWVPTMIVATLAVGHWLPSLGWSQLLGESWDSIAEQEFTTAAIRWTYWMVILSVTLAPWSGLPLTHLLGQVVFERSPSRREAIAALRMRPGAVFWVLGVVRMSVIVVLVAASTWLVDQDNYAPEIIAGLVTLLLLAIRGSRPFIPEMLILERCPLRAGAAGLPLRVRSSALHGPLAGELGGRSLTTGAMAAVLGGSLFYTLIWLRGVLLGQWSYDAIAVGVFLPVSLWTVLSLCTIVRFLGYLDARIRLEGWEVELAMRAEAIRQFGDEADALTTAAVPTAGGKTAKTVAAAVLAVCLTAGLAQPASAQAALQPSPAGTLPPAADLLPSSDWFDASAGQVRPMALPPGPGDEANRRSRWVAKPPKPRTPWNWGNWDFRSLISWLILIAILTAIVGGVLFAMRNAEWSLPAALPGNRAGGDSRLAIDPARIEDLPPEIRNLTGDPRQMAIELAKLGRFDEAVIRLFGHQLLLLDAAGLIRLRRQDTNGVYCRQCSRRDSAIGRLLRRTADAFERSYFGHHPVDADAWSQLWTDHERLESSVRRFSSPPASALPATGKLPAAATMFVGIMAMTGCGAAVDSPYGETRGYVAARSLNGLTGLRTILTTAPAGSDASLKVRDLRVLSGRSLRCDAIVWTPTDWPPQNLSQVSGWLDGWLAGGDRRLVIVLPDAGSELDYLRQSADRADIDGRPRYRRRIAQALSARMADRLSDSELDHPQFFTAKRLVGSTSPTPSPAWSIEPADEAAVAGPVISQSPAPLVPLRGERWGNSEVCVVAGGSLVTNFAMVDPAGRSLAVRLRDRIWQRTGDGDRLEIGFLTSDTAPLPVSRRSVSTPPATGLEFMTTWPISLVTLHGLFLGVVICLALLPIFGRPKSPPPPPTGRFASHLDAMARLLARNAAPDVATGRINRYLHLVRGESDLPPPP